MCKTVVTKILWRHTNQHVHENYWHSKHKQKKKEIGERSVFQFVPRQKSALVVQLTHSHYKDRHHPVRKQINGNLQWN